MLLTDLMELREKIISLKYEINNHGLNLRLTDFQSALGISQLSKINKFLLKRKKINIYKKNLDKIKQIETLNEDRKYISSNHFFNPFKILHMKKDKFIKFILKKLFYNIIIFQFIDLKFSKIKVKRPEIYYKNTISLPIYYS